MDITLVNGFEIHIDVTLCYYLGLVVITLAYLIRRNTGSDES